MTPTKYLLEVTHYPLSFNKEKPFECEMIASVKTEVIIDLDKDEWFNREMSHTNHDRVQEGKPPFSDLVLVAMIYEEFVNDHNDPVDCLRYVTNITPVR